EPGDVSDVQSRSRLVKDDRAAGGAEFGGELESLTFAAGEAGEGLSEGEVVESDVVEPGQDAPDGGPGEVVDSIGDAHLEHVGDVLAGDVMFLGLWGEPSSFADFAAGDHAFHEGEVGVDGAVALTGRASSGGVGGEQPGWCSGGLGEHVTDEVEQAGVSGWVGAARSSDGALVDDDRVGFDGGEVAEDEAGLARSGDSGHSGHHAARDAGGDVL